MTCLPFRAGALLWLRSLSCAAIVLLMSPLLAQPAGTPGDVLRIGKADSYPLSRAFSFIEDSDAAMVLQQVLEADAQGKFRPASEGAALTNFGSTDAAIWLRVRLQADADAPSQWLLEVAHAPLDRMDLYISRSGSGDFEHHAGGDTLPFNQREIRHRNHVKPITLQPGAVTTLYLRIASQGTVSAPVTLWQPAALWHSDQKTYSVLSMYFGLLTGLLLYNLLLFFSVRDRAYLIYVLFVACMGLSQAANSGFGAQFLWPQSLWWSNNSINAANAASGAFGMLFSRSFLASRARMPRLDRWMRLQVALWVAAILLVPVLPYKIEAKLVTNLALVGVATLVAAGAFSLRRRHPGAQYFALAWGILMVGVVTLALHNNGFLPSNIFTANALLVGSALEMVLLSFALADRINIARQEKEAAQAQTVAEQAMVQALEQSQARYRAVIEQVAEGMIVVQERQIVFVNARAAEIFETTREDIVAQGVVRRIHPADRIMMEERIQRRLAGEHIPERCQIRLEWPDRPPKWLEVGDSTVPWDHGLGVLFFFLDVTQRHQAEQDTRTALQRQRELNELRSRFVAMTSHEFRTPLATILSSQDLLRHYSDRLPPAERLEMLGNIEAGVHRMTRMLDRVLLLGKADAHMLEFKPREFDLRALCDELLGEARRLQSAQACAVTLDWHGGLSPRCVLDDKLLRHILGNLLSNAVKYSPAGGEVGLRVFPDHGETVFEVSDHGIGIPAEELGHLFESFHRASNVGDIHGTGLGLAIVKNAVDLHGGSIAVDSSEGQGTRFTVRLRPSV